MRSVTASIRRSPDACWRVLVDPVLMPHWVPGLRRATVVAVGADGLPAEIHFEFSTSLTYSLVYRYDLAAREVRFEPRLGTRDGVRGSARIEAADGGAQLHYSLELGEGRSATDRALGDAEATVAAFAAWMHAR